MTEDRKGASGDRPAQTALVAVWGVALYAGTRGIELLLEAQSMAAGVGQALLAEWGSGRVGVEWSDPATKPTSAVLARRAATGFVLGLGAAGFLVAVLALSRAVMFEPTDGVAPSLLLVGLVTAGLSAWRDELLLHGIAIRAVSSAGTGALGQVLACGATSAGAALGQPDASARTVFVAALLGVVFGALWVRDRGAWQPVFAHAAFQFVTTTVLAGGVAHMRLARDSWAGGDAGLLGGTAAAVALAPLAIVALLVIARGLSPRSATVG